MPVTVFSNHGFLNVERLTQLPPLCLQEVKVRWSDFGRVQRNIDLTTMDEAFLQGHLVLVSDGSFKDSEGSAAWVKASTKTNIRNRTMRYHGFTDFTRLSSLGTIWDIERISFSEKICSFQIPSTASTIHFSGP